MDGATIFGLVIISFVALIMVVIGICQVAKKEDPVGFYNVAPAPKKEEITDIPAWNKKHGIMWILYGVCIELGFWLGYVMPNDILLIVITICGVIVPIPFLILGHSSLEKKYRHN